MTARPMFAAVLAVAALAGAARAEAPASMPPGETPPTIQPAEKGMAGCEKMMQMHEADPGSLDAKTAAMNVAQGPEKIDAIAAVVNALVARNRAMEEACPMMRGGLGHEGPAHGGAHDGAPHDAPAAPSGDATP